MQESNNEFDFLTISVGGCLACETINHDSDSIASKPWTGNSVGNRIDVRCGHLNAHWPSIKRNTIVLFHGL